MNHDSSSLSNEETSNTRCTFCFPCFGSRHSTTTEPWWERVRASSVSRGFMKIREWSEIVAGPRWKTFIRRFNRNKSGGFRHAGKYQYDPLSYALNFDEGQNGEFENDSPDGFRNFSARYVAAVPTLKSDSTDLEQNVAVSSSE
ncbi:hypothetical protein MtrunA17_Chr3g0117901 [Medicago truncatula]|uniref:NHL domain protein n=1 Tax=Medicago truncatula TaxID=3880 RepID=I3T405_MEDTR|nr:uncharacterized protein LOC25489546 [Medicago truncatula]AFK47247.1 unknown [Medicago truncatula]KEH35056.1 NHL domain protein [Medicago truncatula]RHN68804.1 hypothetical protein MtrunA17_Chr3g0117901 [Medicago truncatula]